MASRPISNLNGVAGATRAVYKAPTSGGARAFKAAPLSAPA